MKDRTKSESAVQAILRRVIHSRDFSWLMIGTESLAVCLEAEAEFHDSTREAVEGDLFRQMEALDRAHRETGREHRNQPRVTLLEEERDALQSRVRKLEAELDHSFSPEPGLCECDTVGSRLAAAERMIRNAEISGTKIDPEKLRDAMNGELVFLDRA